MTQEVLHRLRERRQSRLQHSQHEIAGILECSEQQQQNDSGAEEGEPAAEEPRAGPPLPDQTAVPHAMLPDLEDMGDLAQQLAEADQEAGQCLGTTLSPLHCGLLTWHVEHAYMHLGCATHQAVEPHCGIATSLTSSCMTCNAEL